MFAGRRRQLLLAFLVVFVTAFASGWGYSRHARGKTYTYLFGEDGSRRADRKLEMSSGSLHSSREDGSGNMEVSTRVAGRVGEGLPVNKGWADFILLEQSGHQLPVRMRSFIPVLLYHHLVAPGESRHLKNGAIISSEEFQAKIEWLSKNNYYTPTLEEFEHWLKGEISLPPKSVMITFDDGYDSVYRWAFPLLKKHNFRAVVFVIGGFVGHKVNDVQYLSWDEIREMQDSGLVEFENHTFAGHGGTVRKPDLASWPEEKVVADLVNLEESFKLHNIKKPIALAYPFGAKSPQILSALRKLNYQMAFTTLPGPVFQGDTLSS